MVLQKYLTQIILSYARRYIRNIEANLNISLWGGDVVLNNLDLRLDGHKKETEQSRSTHLQLQQRPGIHQPRQRIALTIHGNRMLRIHIPWTSLTSRPVEVTITDVECVLHFKTHVGDYSGGGGGVDGSSSSSSSSSSRPRLPSSASASAPPSLEAEEAAEVGGSGWAAELVTKIIANLTIRIKGLSFNFVEEIQGAAMTRNVASPSTNTGHHNSTPKLPIPASLPDRHIMLSLRIVEMCIQSTTSSYSPQFVELEGPWKLLHKTMHMNHVSIHLGELSTQTPTPMSGVEVKSGVSIARQPIRILADADEAVILRDMSFTLRIRAYLAALGKATMIRLPSGEEDQPTTLCGPAMTLRLEIHQHASLSLSDKQLQFLLHIVQTKAGFVAPASKKKHRNNVHTDHSDDDDEDEFIASTPRRTPKHQPAVITASSLQHLLLEPPMTPIAIPPNISPSKQPQPLLVTPSMQVAPALPPPAVAVEKSQGWTSWLWSMVAEDEEEDSGSTDSAPSSRPLTAQEFYHTFGHLAPRDEIHIACQIPAISLDLRTSRINREGKSTSSSSSSFSLPSSSPKSHTLLTLELERLTFAQQRPTSSSSSSSSVHSLASPNSRPGSTRHTPTTSGADLTGGIAKEVASGIKHHHNSMHQQQHPYQSHQNVTDSHEPPSIEGSLRIGSVNIRYTDATSDVKHMFTWLAHGQTSVHGTSSASSNSSEESIVLVGEWSSSRMEWECFAFDLFVPFDILSNLVTLLEPLRMPTTSKSAPVSDDARERRKRRYQTNRKSIKLIMHAGRVRIGHVPSKGTHTSRTQNPSTAHAHSHHHQTLSASVQWQIIHLLSGSTSCEPSFHHAVLLDSLELRVVDLSVSIDLPRSALTPSRPVFALARSKSGSTLSATHPTDEHTDSAIILAPMTAVIHIVARAKVLTVDPEVAEQVTELSLEHVSRIFWPFYRDTHIDMRIQNLHVHTEPDQVLHSLTIIEAFRQLVAATLIGSNDVNKSSADPSSSSSSSPSSVGSITPPDHPTLSSTPTPPVDPLLLKYCLDDLRTLKSSTSLISSPLTRPRPGGIVCSDQIRQGTRTIAWKYPAPRKLTKVEIGGYRQQQQQQQQAHTMHKPNANGVSPSPSPPPLAPLLLNGFLYGWDSVTSRFKLVSTVVFDYSSPSTISWSIPPILASEWKMVFQIPIEEVEREETKQTGGTIKDNTIIDSHLPSSLSLPSAQELCHRVHIDSLPCSQRSTNLHLNLAITNGRLALGGSHMELLVVHFKTLSTHVRTWIEVEEEMKGMAAAIKIRFESLWINAHQHVDKTQYPIMLPMKVRVNLRQNNFIRVAQSDAAGGIASSSLSPSPSPPPSSSPSLPIPLADDHPSSTTDSLGWSLSWNEDRTKLTVLTQLLVTPKLISHRIQSFLEYLPSSVSRQAAHIFANDSNSPLTPPVVSPALPSYYIPHHPSGLPDLPHVSLWDRMHRPPTQLFPPTPWINHPPPLNDQNAQTTWTVDINRLQAERPAVTTIQGKA